MLALIILPIISIISDYSQSNFPSDKILDKDIHGNPNSSSHCTYGKLCSWREQKALCEVM